LILRFRDGSLDLSTPRVMGVLNLTSDSFSDGGRYVSLDKALAHARQMAAEGADLIDVGGESTRPGAEPVSEQEELDRVVPVIEQLRHSVGCVLSIDTMKPAVMRAACAAGAQLVNDVNALRAPGAIEAVRDAGAAACLMHMQGEPRTMQVAPHYLDVLAEITGFLLERVHECVDYGLSRESLLLDPGFGFGKTLEHNLSLLARIPAIAALGFPVLVGLSRKSMFQKLCGVAVDQRLPASLAAATAAVLGGAHIVRAHDVRETRDAVRVAAAIRAAGEETS
jgi:dihydropteroate synthase